jgi:hypothetical protein
LPDKISVLVSFDNDCSQHFNLALTLIERDVTRGDFLLRRRNDPLPRAGLC